MRATWISLGVLALTAGVQLAVVAASGSVALLADSIHNLTDALTAIPLLVAFRLARKPPSRRYPYGYHRAEDVAGLAIVMLIGISAVVAGIAGRFGGWCIRRTSRRSGGCSPPASWGSRERSRCALPGQGGARIGSAALVADGLHARTDGLASLGVIVAAIGAMLGFPRSDAVVGLAITVAIVMTLWQAARTVLHRALDGTDETTLSLIEAVAGAVDGVEHVQDARARWSGHRLLAELSVRWTRRSPCDRPRDRTRASGTRCCMRYRAWPTSRCTSSRMSMRRIEVEPASTVRARRMT